MGDIELLSWNYKDTPELFSSLIKKDYQYFENMMESRTINKYIILITCNRVEIYFRPETSIAGTIEGAVHLEYPDSVNHLFKVASGLESMALGENDILRQIKSAYDLSNKRGKSDKFLSYTFQKALSVGKDVRTMTDIAHGKTSLASISLQIIEKEYGISAKKICIIGTGKMATALLNYLAGSGSTITVAGRNIDHSRELAIKHGAYYCGISNISELINSNQIIITATSSKQYIIKKEDYLNADKDKIFIDLSNPPNIEKANNIAIKLYDLDRIYSKALETRKQRRMEIKKAEDIVKNEFALYSNKINEMKSDEIISAFYKFADIIKENEIDELKRKVYLSDKQLETINIMMNSFTNKILAPYTNSMKTFVRNNEKYSYILKEYDTMLKKVLSNGKKVNAKE
ncbi:glutamyl-tRNA reductase [Ferroplasma sp.]|uniref:glutamyl-tRNA reductase n=1 Tax=Ferroplasma sp. TaxID=2591003 RepID=UPI00307EE386